jgi:hypothetical protein
VVDTPLQAAVEALRAARSRLLREPRPGPTAVLVAELPGAVAVVLPLQPDEDSGPAAGRVRRLGAAAAGALVTAGGLRPPSSGAETALEAHAHRELLALVLEVDEPAETTGLVELALEEQSQALDRVRLRPLIVVGAVPLDPIAAPAWLWRAEMAGRLGARPGAARLPDDVEQALDALEASRPAPPPAGVGPPHADPVPARRALRRILQRLDGMGKYGGFHTEFRHLARGFAGGERALALAAGEALLRAGLLVEKPSVGQRHVSLVAARTAEIRRLVETGETDAPELRAFLRASG